MILSQTKKKQLYAWGIVIPPGQPFRVNGSQYQANLNRWRIIVDCPFCGKQHLHGWEPDIKRRNKIRQAHCGGYRKIGGADTYQLKERR